MPILGRRSVDTAPAAGEILFISDLHLSPRRPLLTRLFIDFLEQRAPAAARLFILGDLFDAWIGDDDNPLPEVLGALWRFKAKHRQCLLMRGNRDFLLGRGFARATGCRLIPDPFLLRLNDEPILLMHGDLLCTDDLAYQRFRRRVRNPLVQRLFLWLPLSKRRRIAAQYRQRSGEAMATKPDAIMDVNEDAIRRQLRRFSARRLIHGHTHRPGDHLLQLDGQPLPRQVLADWRDDAAELLSYRAGVWHREPWPAK